MTDPVVLLLILAGGLLVAAAVLPALSRPRDDRRRRPDRAARPNRDRDLPRDADPATARTSRHNEAEPSSRSDHQPSPAGASSPGTAAFRAGYAAARRRRRGATVDATRNAVLRRLHLEVLEGALQRFIEELRKREEQALRRWHHASSRSEEARDAVVTTRAEAERATAAENAAARPRFGVFSRTGVVLAISLGVVAFDAFIFDDMLMPLGHSPQTTAMMAIGFGLAVVVLGHFTGLAVETGYVQPHERRRWRILSQVTAPLLVIGAVAFMVSVAHSRGINTQVAQQVEQDALRAQATPPLASAGRPGSAPATGAAPSSAAPASTSVPSNTTATPAQKTTATAGDDHKGRFSTTFFSIYQGIAFLAMAVLSLLFAFDAQAWDRRRRRERAERARAAAERRSISMERASVNAIQAVWGIQAEVHRHAETALRRLQTINLRAEEGAMDAGADSLVVPLLPELEEICAQFWAVSLLDTDNMPLPSHARVREQAPGNDRHEHAPPGPDEPFSTEEPPGYDEPHSTETPSTPGAGASNGDPGPKPPGPDPVQVLSDHLDETPMDHDQRGVAAEHLAPSGRFQPKDGVAYVSPNGLSSLVDDDDADDAR